MIETSIDRWQQIGRKLKKVALNQQASFQFVNYLLKNTAQSKRQVSDDYTFKIVDQLGTQVVMIFNQSHPQQDRQQNRQQNSKKTKKQEPQQSNINMANFQALERPENRQKCTQIQKTKTGFLKKNHPEDGYLNLQQQYSNNFRQVKVINQLLTDSAVANQFKTLEQSMYQSQIFQKIHIKDNSNDFKRLNILKDEQNLSLHQTEQIQEQYFEIKLSRQTNINSLVPKDVRTQITTHQVKQFIDKNDNHSKRSQSNQKSLYNLSNFSSFNCQSLHHNNSPKSSAQQRQFYEKQFVYLIKNIELKQQRKLSQKGIQKIAEQLKKILESSQFSQSNKFEQQKKSPHQKMKNLTEKVFYKKSSFSREHKINCDSNRNNKTKLNQNLPISTPNCQYPSVPSIQPLETNNSISKSIQMKNNLKQPLRINQQISNLKGKTINESKNFKSKKENENSNSPVTYKVLMEKKKTQKQAQKLKFDSSKNQIQNQISSNSRSMVCENKNGKIQGRSSQSANDNQGNMLINKENESTYEKKKSLVKNKFKSNLLKIMIQPDNKNEKIKSLYFNYSQCVQRRVSLVQRYCLQNRISGENKQSILEAIQNQKSIITLQQ